MRVSILTDIEGVCGVVGRADSIGNKILNKDAADRLLTGEVNAAAEGLAAGGATDIVCWDGHGGSNSILIEQLHPMVRLLQSGGVMDPVFPQHQACDVFVQLGAHAMNGTRDGFLNHTYNSHGVVRMLLNGEPIGEIGMGSLLAAEYGMRTILISGDRAACREAREMFACVETVETKIGLNRYTAVNHPVEQVRQELRTVAERALRNAASYPLIRKNPPYELKVELMDPTHADHAEMRGARRLDAVTVAYEGDDLIAVYSQRLGWGIGQYRKRYP